MSAAPDLTRNQELVLGTLLRVDGPLSAYQILDELRGEGLRAPLQVYRALDKLTEMKLVHRIETLNAFVACSHHAEHAGETVAFAICEACGKVTEFSDPALQKQIGAWTRRHDFLPARTTLEIKGLCAACR
ncbi:Fur family transcriptional regulator [Afifella pfennigii]|uniref:Fur family transcriptional regulator n=1 Tax=Afifella pfennigii TaxID=209897 RepID=UPI00047EE104|nr:Fur family transcriptional regulator [Afifella pfennigii]